MWISAMRNFKRIVAALLAAFLLAPAQAWGAWASVGSICSGNDKTSPFSYAYSGGLTTDHIVVICIASDNNGTTDGNFNEISLSDPGKTNTYTKVTEFTNGQGAANAGATVAAFVMKVVDNTQVGFDATITGSPGATAVTCWDFTIGGGNVVTTSGTPQTLANDGADAGSITLGSLANAEHLFVRCGAVESSGTTYTQSTSYTSFTHTSSTTSGGGSAANMGARGEFRILTATSDSTDPTTSASDQASIMFALDEGAAPTGGCNIPIGLMGVGC